MGDILMTSELSPQVLKKRLCIGTIEGARVTLELEIETKNRPAKTTALKEVTSYKSLSICCESVRHSGQSEDWIRKNLDCMELYVSRSTVERILEIWDQWHLNDLNAGCEHQTAMGWNKVKLDDSKELTQDNMASWARPEDNPKGLLTKPCPVCGYKYGTSWLVGALPEDIEHEIVNLFDSTSEESQSKESEYERHAKEVLKKHGIKLSIRRGDYKDPTWEGSHGDHYKVTVTRKGDKRISFSWWGSVAMMQDGTEPTAYDILACISSDSGYPTDPDEVIQELGEMPIKQARATARFAEKLQTFFSEEELEDIRQVS